MTKNIKTVNKVFKKMVGKRFKTYKDMETYFKNELGTIAKNIYVTACEGINEEITNGEIKCDYSTDCTFGENSIGFDYADFTISYIYDNDHCMIVTMALFN